MNGLINNIISYAKESHRFSAPELQSKLQIGYREFADALKTLQGNDTLKFIGGMIYEYSAEPKTDERPAEHQSKEEGEDEDNLMAQRRAYLEKRRQELIRRMQAEMADDDDDNIDDEENDEDNDEADDKIITATDEVSDTMPEEHREGVGNLCAVLKKVAAAKEGESNISDKFLDEMKGVVGGELFEVYRSICYAHICAKGLTFSNGEKAEFFIHHYGNITELCDGGAISKWIQSKPGYGYKRTKKTLEKLTDGLKIRLDDREQLLIDVSDLSKLPTMYYYFYWVLESLIG